MHDTVDLRSDTLTLPTPEMREAMARAEVGDDVWGEDPTVQRLEALAAARLGKEAGLFVASGTMGNLVSVLAQTRAGQEVELSIADAPKLEGARRVVVKTIPNDTRVRYATWIREMRDYVDKKSNGQGGYVHLYDMGGFGLSQFARDYPPQWNKQGFIIDDRWNHGGFVATMILSHLDRKIFSVGKSRHGIMYTSPDRCFTGHMACLINRQGGSDCETFAQGFKDFGMGPVVGTRTWGGWVGIRSDKKLRDGGIRTFAEAAQACLALTKVLEAQHRAGWSEPVIAPGRIDIERTFSQIDSYPYRHRVRDVMSARPQIVAADKSLGDGGFAVARRAVN